MNFISFFLSEKLFFYLSILSDSFVGYSNLGCRSLLFITLNILCQSLLACKVSVNKSAEVLIRAPLHITKCSSLAALKDSLFGFGLVAQ